MHMSNSSHIFFIHFSHSLSFSFSERCRRGGCIFLLLFLHINKYKSMTLRLLLHNINSNMLHTHTHPIDDARLSAIIYTSKYYMELSALFCYLYIRVYDGKKKLRFGLVRRIHCMNLWNFYENDIFGVFTIIIVCNTVIHSNILKKMDRILLLFDRILWHVNHCF